jgi:hypothetical protein
MTAYRVINLCCNKWFLICYLTLLLSCSLAKDYFEISIITMCLKISADDNFPLLNTVELTPQTPDPYFSYSLRLSHTYFYFALFRFISLYFALFHFIS